MAIRGTLAALVLVLAPAVSLAQDDMAGMPGMGHAGMGHAGMGAENPPSATCAATDKDLPSDLAAWTSKAPLAAATKAAGLAAATLVPGKAVAATLSHTAEVSYVTQPEKPGGTVSYGGLLAFDVSQAGTYRVALGAGPWIDVLKDGQPVTSTAHGHGPACSSVRKMVDFPLTPGRYVIQISADAEPTLGILVARLP